MRISEFLLARVRQDEVDAEAHGYEHHFDSHDGGGVFERRRTAIHRHHDRSITVVSTGAFQTVSRCGVCIREFTRPCRVLMSLAQADNEHPDYDHAWDLPE